MCGFVEDAHRTGILETLNNWLLLALYSTLNWENTTSGRRIYGRARKNNCCRLGANNRRTNNDNNGNTAARLFTVAWPKITGYCSSCVWFLFGTGRGFICSGLQACGWAGRRRRALLLFLLAATTALELGSFSRLLGFGLHGLLGWASPGDDDGRAWWPRHSPPLLMGLHDLESFL
ncbi:hypothetical protein L596_020536 [Steinernema carpocapsae]|uniref:Uncharacterized protein n=1 Tax=Steinernema carpocapsae TaxID=34508 RepID=A0A4U5MU16_STECR|nr:hypothetical protein L596_020536 [Steinernema carpocapsae]